MGEALDSIFQQDVPVEVFVLDGGSTDDSLDVIRQWSHRLSGWRSGADNGQAAAVNEGIAMGSAPFVCWLNSDDWYLEGGMRKLLEEIQSHPQASAVYGRCWNVKQGSGCKSPVWVESFDEKRLASRCIISQPATLIRRSAWEAIGGVDSSLHMAMDYDLWWRLFKHVGVLKFLDHYVAVNREHPATKTRTLRYRHYQEAIDVVRKYHGTLPLRWWLARPYSVWWKSVVG